MKAAPQMDGAPVFRNHRNANRARKLGYAILPGDTFSFLLHLRPREWPIMVAHTGLGYLLAAGSDMQALRDSSAAFALALVVWVVCLNGGTLALNSAFDEDEGDIGYLDAPPPPPRYLAHFAYFILILGQLGALLVSFHVALVYLFCFLLSVLYSVPPFRLKAVAGADWLINLVGFGALTPLAGWLATGQPLTGAGILAMAGFGALFAGFYPLTQLYQIAEDTARGDRTLAIVLGVRRSLLLAVAFTFLAFFLFAAAVVASGRGLRYSIALIPALAMWLVVLQRWLSAASAMNTSEHKHGMYRALLCWAGTDVAVLISLVV